MYRSQEHSIFDLRIKAMFFDRAKVINAIDKATVKALSRAGQIIRRAARASIRENHRGSLPGRPPHSHTGLLRRFILYAYESATRSVVIGPAKLNRAGEAPHVLEFGGQTTMMSHRWVDNRLVHIPRRVTIAARPYMGPALEKKRAKLPQEWANSVKG